MPEKDEFTFDDNDDFPETDLSGAFADAEQEALGLSDDPEPPDAPETPGAFSETGEMMEEPPPPRKSKGGGPSKSRTLLLVLLLVIVAAAGAYYFMGLGGMTSEPPVPPQKSQQVVAVPPPQPTKAPVVVPVQPVPQKPATTPAADTDAKAVASPDKTEAAAAAKVDPVASKEQEEKQEEQKQPQAVAAAAVPAKPEPAPAVSTGTYVLDAGAFLFASQREELKKKISALGYKPVVSQVQASVRLIRLRVGSFSKDQLAAALDDVRKIAPGAFSLARDGQHVVYAGSFADQHNVQRLRKRFLEKGITVVEEPVKVDRNLSRIQFGVFADDASAEAAARQAEQAGIPVRVVSK
ncbi:MAG: SPOR domain-containing protein [Desulfuromonadales bacterium]|nr:SPOR domain-containing protein [Desulfuromonadales bacterium]